MSVLETKVNTIIDLLLAVDDSEYFKARHALADLRKSVEEPVFTGVDEKIEQFLLDVGVPANLAGYRYLAATIEYCMDHLDNPPKMTGEIYPAIAKKFNSTPSRVERSIRHAIETAWNRSDWSILSKHFGNTINPELGKPTNSEFLWRAAYIIRKTVSKG